MKKLALVSAVAALVITETGQAAVALDPQAIDLEPFRFIPTLLAEMKQDSNIYSLSDNEVSSFVTVLKPTFDLVAQDRDNLYTARYGIIGGFYGESDNNYLDHVFSVNAHVEPTGRFRFDVGAGYNFLHEDLGVLQRRCRIVVVGELDIVPAVLFGEGAGDVALGLHPFAAGVATHRHAELELVLGLGNA